MRTSELDYCCGLRNGRFMHAHELETGDCPICHGMKAQTVDYVSIKYTDRLLMICLRQKDLLACRPEFQGWYGGPPRDPFLPPILHPPTHTIVQ